MALFSLGKDCWEGPGRKDELMEQLPAPNPPLTGHVGASTLFKSSHFLRLTLIKTDTYSMYLSGLGYGDAPMAPTRRIVIVSALASVIARLQPAWSDHRPGPRKAPGMRVQDLFALITTDNLDQCRDFYVRHFGFAVAFDSAIYLQLTLTGDQDRQFSLAFMPSDHPFGVVSARPFNGHGLMITLQVADSEEAYRRILGEGVAILHPLTVEAWGQKRFTLRDPAGVAVDVVQNDGIATAPGYYEQFAKGLPRAMTMASSPKVLWPRYSAIWSTRDPALRHSELASCLSADATYCDPNGLILGPGALSDYMAEYQTRVPEGAHFKIRSVLEHHGRTLAHWDFLMPDGDVVYKGTSVAHMARDGRFQEITGFFQLS